MGWIELNEALSLAKLECYEASMVNDHSLEQNKIISERKRFETLLKTRSWLYTIREAQERCEKKESNICRKLPLFLEKENDGEMSKK